MIQSRHKHEAQANPFSSRFVRPGVIEFQFPNDQSVDQLTAILRRNLWWGQIVGPHGSGKSTLLHSLAPALERAGRAVFWIKLSSQDRSLSLTADVRLSWTNATQVIVDGYEQLDWRSRRRLKRVCRRCDCGLLVTTHRPAGLSDVFRTSVAPQLAYDVVEDLLRADCSPITRSDIDSSYARHEGNLRETLFDLYDVFERRRYDRESR